MLRALHEAYARAGYQAALDAQRQGIPSSVRAGILIAHAEEWERVRAQLEVP